MKWGFAGPWYGEFLMRNGEYLTAPVDQLEGKLDFLMTHGLVTTGMGVQAFAELDNDVRERITERLVVDGLELTAGVGCDYISSTEAQVREYNDRAIEWLSQWAPAMRTSIVCIHKGPRHRFDRNMPVEQQMAKMVAGYTPVAEACAGMGLPLCMENHGDYYCSDLVELCKAVPNMYIFLDTGNTYLAGEKPLPAFQEAAPYVVGGHFKDHFVEPVAKTLTFEIHGAALGEGHVPLRECYELLVQHGPDPDAMVMELEMICPRDGSMTPLECLERSLAFVRSLEPAGVAT